MEIRLNKVHLLEETKQELLREESEFGENLDFEIEELESRVALSLNGLPQTDCDCGGSCSCCSPSCGGNCCGIHGCK